MSKHRADQSAAVRALKSAAPYIRLFKNKVFVVKAGGAVFGEKLGWEPEITAREMCVEMVAEDLRVAQRPDDGVGRVDDWTGIGSPLTLVERDGLSQRRLDYVIVAQGDPSGRWR